ncbi:hypothetical protein JL722_1363 [Aureococcus anophagefferens]|nr:hypothetical protein JL722_1363 [Aureococcus anophagefferens]
MTDYRDGYPRRLWVKVGDRATGRASEAWRGAVTRFVVWAHDETQAWKAEVNQAKAKIASAKTRSTSRPAHLPGGVAHKPRAAPLAGPGAAPPVVEGTVVSPLGSPTLVDAVGVSVKGAADFDEGASSDEG